MKLQSLLIGLLLSVMVLFASSSTANTAKASATPCSSLPVYTYYRDATYTVVCGVWDVCEGTYPECWTDYRTSIRKICCDPK